jgi:hypothetical protein
MGGGSFDKSAYYSSASTRKAAGVDDFDYSKKSHVVHDSLKPKRIKDKVFSVLESRDNAEHPESTAIIVCFDVTGSNVTRAAEAQKTLPGLMTLLEKYISDPQIAVAANDDYFVEPDRCFQMSEFESDNRIDDHIRNIKLVSNGGGNAGESYDLVLYAAAHKTATDCFEKRGKKGYLFLYADEPILPVLDVKQVAHVFGDKIDIDIPIETLVEQVTEKWEVFLFWPVGGYQHARDQYVKLFGDDHVITLQHPNKISEMIGITIGIFEGKTTTAAAVDDLVSVGVSASTATTLTKSLAGLESSRAVGKSNGGHLEVGGSGANRL